MLHLVCPCVMSSTEDDATDHVVSVRLDDVESMVHFIDNHNPDVEVYFI
jgi:hypothetical protein